MANTRNQHVVGGGLGTFRAQGRARHALRIEHQATQRQFEHLRAIQAMSRRTTQDSLTAQAA